MQGPPFFKLQPPPILPPRPLVVLSRLRHFCFTFKAFGGSRPRRGTPFALRSRDRVKSAGSRPVKVHCAPTSQPTAGWVILDCARPVQLMSLGTGLVAGHFSSPPAGGPRVAEEASLESPRRPQGAGTSGGFRGNSLPLVVEETN